MVEPVDEKEVNEGRLAALGYAIETSEITLASTQGQLRGLKQTMDALQVELEAVVEEHDQTIGDAEVHPAQRAEARALYEEQAKAEEAARNAIKTVTLAIDTLQSAITRLEAQLEQFKELRASLTKGSSA